MSSLSEGSAEPTRVASILDRLHSRLRRVTLSTAYVPEIDGLRFVAIGSVLLYHLTGTLMRTVGPREWGWFHDILRCGNIGVQLFFAISGFILAVPFLEAHLGSGRPMGLKRYYLRRLTRLEPPYLINLLLFFFILKPGLKDGLHHLGWSAVYAHGFAYHRFSTINFVAWSLEVEVQFYVLMPLIAWVFFRGRPWVRRTALIVLCMPFMLRQHQLYNIFPHGFALTDQIQFFVVGIILADVYVNEWRAKLGSQGLRGYAFDLMATVGWISIPAIMLVEHPAARFVVPVGIAVAYIGSLRGHLWRALFRNRWICVIGGMCYTIYLYHWMILQKTLGLFGGFPAIGYLANLLIVGPLLLAAVLVVSTLFFMAVERPFMAWRPRQGGGSSK